MIEVRVHRITYQAPAILSFDLVPVDGSQLPPFTAGSHIDVHLAGGLVRQYSLYNSPTESHRYRIAVLNEPSGRGGSRAMHTVRAGDVLSISEPRNHFALVPGAAECLLIAGGIGITPILAMVDELYRSGVRFVLHYCTRSLEVTAFRRELAAIAKEGCVRLHHDGGVPGRGLKVSDLLAEVHAGTQVYCCGPTGLMNAVRTAAGHWPAGTVHFESFAAPALPAASSSERDFDFEVEIASSGAVIGVPRHMTMLESLRAHAVDVNTSCEAGTCGTCMTRYLAGEPDHQDFVLDEEQQREFVMVCVSRSKSRRLKLDL